MHKYSSSVHNPNLHIKQKPKTFRNNTTTNSYHGVPSPSQGSSDLENQSKETHNFRVRFKMNNNHIKTARTILNERGRERSSHSIQNENSNGIRSFSQGLNNSLYEFGKSSNQMNDSEVQQNTSKFSNKESSMGSILAWNENKSHSQIKSYSALTNNLKSPINQDASDSLSQFPTGLAVNTFQPERKRSPKFENNICGISENSKMHKTLNKGAFTINQKHSDEISKIMKL